MISRVSKPWGFEDRACFSSNLGVTYLEINKSTSTSLHCHPTKLTSMVCVQGTGELRFLNSYEQLRPGEGFTLREKLFHEIANTSDSQPLVMLEFESPNDKNSLSRLDDRSGRISSNYESNSTNIEDSVLNSLIRCSHGASFQILNLSLTLMKFDELNFSGQKAGDAFVVMKGGLWDRDSGLKVLDTSEFIRSAALKKLMQRYSIVFDSLLLKIAT